jgi:ComF family protein
LPTMRLRRLARTALSPIVDVLLPPGCWAGGAGEAPFGLSHGVREQVAALAAQPYCTRCGLTIGDYAAENPCSRCGTREIGVLRFARVGTFSDPLVSLVHRFKFGRAWEIAGVLAPFLYQAISAISERTRTPVDLLVPVPLHWRRRAHRGFNQAEELAREVSAVSGWKNAPLLRRPRNTREQAKLDSPHQRLENLRGAFTPLRSAARRAAGKHVWLIDDVSTTGATLCAAAIALRKIPRDQRPASINAAVICVTDPKSPPAAPPI